MPGRLTIRLTGAMAHWRACTMIFAALILTAACSGVKTSPTPTAELSRSGATQAVEIGIGEDLISRAPPSLENIWFEHYSSEHALAVGPLECMLQDSSGFLWFGSHNGLARYDGYDLKVYGYDPNDPQSISSNAVDAILEDRAGRLWIGTYGGGLEKFDPHQGVFVHHQHDPARPESLSDDKVYTLFEDDQGFLWVGTSGGGLNRLDPETGQFEHFRYDAKNDASLSSDWVNKIYQDNTGALWVGTTNGLNRLDRRTNEFTRYLYDPQDTSTIGGDQVYAILQDRNGYLWIGTFDGGLSRLDPQTGRFKRYLYDPLNQYSLSSNSIFTLLEDRWGNIWIGTIGGGLTLLDPVHEKFYRYQHDPSDPQSLSSDFVNMLYEDRTGVLWIGTTLSLDRYDPNKPKFGLRFARNHVFSLYESRSGILWVGALDGLYRFDREIDQVFHYRHIPGLENSLSEWWVTSIAEDRAGSLWIGTAGGGLNHLNPSTGRFTHYRNDPLRSDSLSSNVVNSVYVDRGNTLWVGTVNGLNQFDRKAGSFIHFPLDSGGGEPAGSEIIKTILEDSEGYLWIGTQGGGLKQLNPAKDELTTYRFNPSNPGSLRNNVINILFEDSQRYLWVGSEGGLHLFDRETGSFRQFDQQDGLLDDNVHAILEDASSRLWLSTDNGLSRLNPGTGEIKNFDSRDGLQANQFSGAAYLRDDGEIYFGGINGITTFFPDQIRENPYAPAVALLSIRQGGIPVRTLNSYEEVDSITLSGAKNEYEFEYAALSYSQPEENQYAYMLAGLDTGWNYIGTQRIVHLTDIPPGTYTLRMKAANDDGTWNESGRSIQLTIVPPFWETLWFRGLILLVIAGSISGGYVIRIKSIAARNKELEALVVERTREIDRRRQELEALYRADALMHRSLHLDQVLQALVDVAVDILNADKSAVFTWTEDAEALVMRVNRGFDAGNIARFTCSPREGLLGRVIAHGELLCVEDVQQPSYQEVESPNCYQAYLDEDIHTLIVLPIWIAGEVFAVFAICFTQSHVFGEEEVRLFSALAQRAGLAIENAQLYESAQLLAVIEERSRMARDLHDSVKQNTFAALAQLGSASRLLDHSSPAARVPLETAEDLMQEVLVELNTMIQEMYPVALKQRGLTSALRALAYDWGDRHSILVDLHIDSLPKTSEEKSQALYRITQEALSNVSRHSHASKVVLDLRGSHDNIELRIEDDGCGYNPQEVYAGVGLRSMRERAERFSGSFRIESAPDLGTRVFVEIPA